MSKGIGRASIALLGIVVYGVLAVSSASAETYVGAYLGAAIPSDEDADVTGTILGETLVSGTVKDVDLDTSVVFGGKIGYYFEDLEFLGLEVEAYHFSPDAPEQEVRFNGDLVEIDKADIDVTAIGINALLRLPLAEDKDFPRGRIQPYAGIGLGIFIASLETVISVEKDEDTDTAVGFQILGGLRYFLTREIALFAEYKFIDTGDFKFKGRDSVATGTVEGDLTVHQIYGGIAFHF